jgi:hypothetical protein
VPQEPTRPSRSIIKPAYAMRHLTNDLTRQFAQDHIEALRSTHSELQAWWRALDQKAQWNTGICTVLLGGGFWTVEHSAANSALGIVVIILVLTTLFGSLALSISAMVVRNTKSPPGARDLDRDVRTILQECPPTEIDKRILGSFLDQTSRWIESIEDDSKAGLTKAKTVRSAQWMLLGATALIAILAGLKAVRPDVHPPVVTVVAGSPGPPGPPGPSGCPSTFDPCCCNSCVKQSTDK